ncbi:hypothetical protein PX554_20245 [Sphingomonas sp. H39-1-10]|uniref:hypothetical protein n=1 Tax=Sphingomonas pollutisoli TaxID=3030829 RepID=UPI0023BA1620|nr:hypothetical protein [Sphingomonas pollutisoli]MDF0490465.1 hypothetical protein [Sphingomonas pollutisoli]
MATQYSPEFARADRKPAPDRRPRGVGVLLQNCLEAEASGAPASDPVAAKGGDAPGPRRLGIGDMIHFFLHLLGVVISSQLIVWGMFFLLFLLLGNASIDGMMHQLANLSTRYVAAGLDRQMQFKWIFAAADLLLCAGVLLLRWRHLLPPERPGAASDV